MLNAILYWLNTGIPWRDLPERFGPWQSVYSRFRAWTKAGVWEDILTALIAQDLVDETTLMLDSTTIKARQHASGVKKGDTTRKLDGAEGVNHESPLFRTFYFRKRSNQVSFLLRFLVEGMPFILFYTNFWGLYPPARPS